ncbi:hypothetical protein H261_16316 [Paramagnetospirillum caucaseum]|uniref:EAL domain-containing protein n=1 Tax=Paramagnetospirillum caucaseum TaxID=1244869 RepID=M2Z3B1_9PROT|nr:EAL domain-containing protein [Paramagnetospirillum caucaseum]EME68845.1 hypothetical protein H261_16316 [Paramagnetospirillum caucaseum]
MNAANNDDTKPAACGLAWRLHELLGATKAHEGRRLSFLALDPARKHFGHDWPRVSGKVHGLVATTLKSFLSEGDVYSAADEFSYIIMSSGRAASDFDKLMEDISSEISSRLTGKGIAKQLVAIIHLNADTDAHHGGERRISTLAAIDPKDHLNNIERIMEEADSNVVEFKIGDVKTALSPVLALGTMSTSAWACLASRVDEDDAAHFGYDVLPAEADPLLFAELDALTVEYAAKRLKEAADRHMIVQLPVHRITLSSKKYREMYLKICHGMLANRKERIVFDIHGIDEGTPSNRIAEFMQWLRPYGKSIAITLGIDFSTVAAFSGTGAVSIGTDIRALDDTAAIQKIGKFAGRAKAANMKCHIHGISSKFQAELCLKLDIDFMDGELILDTTLP